MVTDGVPEMTIHRSGRQLGNGALTKVISTVDGLPVGQACANFIDHLQNLRGSLPLDDDMTTVFIDIKGDDDDA